MAEISKISAVAIANVAKVDAVTKANIAEINGLTIPSAGVGTPAAAYSVRLLGSAVGISSYTGACMRVRRASDSVEADVGFDTSDELSLTSPISNTSDAQSYTDLADFVDHTGTPTDAFCRYWYDQSSSNDAGQATAGSQPQIYDASTGLITNNGKPSLSFDGSGDNLQYAGNFLGGSAATGVSVSSFDNATRAAREIIWGAQDSSGSRYDFLVTRQASNAPPQTHVQNGIDLYVEGDPPGNTVAGTITDTNQHLLTTIYSNNTRRIIYNNGTALSTWTDYALGNLDDATAFWIGADISGGTNSIDGQIQEVIVWNSDQEAANNRSGIESNINGYFSIFTP